MNFAQEVLGRLVLSYGHLQMGFYRRPKLPLRSFLRARGALPTGRRQLEELGGRAASALFEQLTEDGNRSAAAAVRQREWRLEER